jgi:hypothetical protein
MSCLFEAATLECYVFIQHSGSQTANNGQMTGGLEGM